MCCIQKYNKNILLLYTITHENGDYLFEESRQQ